MEFYDFPLREFEYPDLTFELVVSASCYAQLKRHRMATMTAQPYDPELYHMSRLREDASAQWDIRGTAGVEKNRWLFGSRGV
jgi:thymidylate synthase ThyX